MYEGAAWTLARLEKKKRESGGLELHTRNEKLGLLLKWCRVVCAFYGVKIENFTVSFGDGRALCYLVHHYHPALVPENSIKSATMATYYADMEQRGQGDLDNSFSNPFSPAVVSVPENPALYEELLANEKDNFKLLYEKVSELGGIPLMLRSVDMSNTIPDEKVVVTYVTYLCSRLLDIRHESRAARIIQLAWRKYYLKKSQKELEVKQAAAIVIQRRVRTFIAKLREKKQTSAAIKIQSVWRGHAARKLAQQIRYQCENALKIRAARIIKRYLQTYVLRKKYLLHKKSAILIQAHVRGYSVRCRLREQQNAAKMIQNWYLSNKCMKSAREEFKLKRKSAVIIQRFVRDWLQKTSAAVKLQSFVRGYFARKRYLMLRDSAVICQQRYRCKKLGLEVQKNFSIKRNAVIKIQAWYRGQVVRNTIQKQQRSATVIQAWYKSCVQRNTFLSMKNAARTIQSLYRRSHVTKCIRQKYLITRQSVVTIQKYYRGFMSRKHYRETLKCIIKIQSHIRCLTALKSYRRLKWSTDIIQKRYRAHIAGLKQRRHYQTMKKSAIVIQSAYRAARARKDFRRHKSAQLIQANFRGFLQRRKYLALRKAAICLQSNYRSYHIRKEYQHIKTVISILQRRFRATLKMRQCRHDYQSKVKAVVLIQCVTRGFIQRQKYKHQIEVIKKLQSRVKGYQQLKRFRLVKTSAAIIQRQVRIFLDKCRESRRQRDAAIKIQSAVKCYLIKKQFISLRNAVLVCQRRYRENRLAHQAWRKFMISKGAAITIQAWFRGQKERNRLQKQHHSATVIQACYRKHKEMQRYHFVKCAAKTIQDWYRVSIKTKTCRQKYLQMRNSAIIIQKCYKCFVQRRKYSTMKLAAKCIQSHYKAYRVRKEYKHTISAIIALQRKMKATLLMRQCRHDYQNKIKSAIIIQSFIRGLIERQRYIYQVKCITRLQARIHGYLQLKKFRLIKSSAILIQRQVRNFLGKCREQKKQLAATLVIQSAARGYLVRKHLANLKNAVLVCQRRYRANKLGRQVWREFMITKGAAITIQAWFRGQVVRKALQKQHQSAKLIQTCYRRHLQMKKFQTLKYAAKTVQTWYRGCVAARTCRWEYLKVKESVITIQKHYRQFIQRKRYLRLKCAAVCLQSHYKAYRVRNEYKQTRSAVITLQRRFRAKTLGRRVWREFMITKGAAITIQAHFRGKLVRNRIQKQHQSATLIQACYRRHLQVRQFKSMKGAAKTIQTWYRRCLETKTCRKRYLQIQHSVVTIQKHFRCFMKRNRYLRLKCAVVYLQSHYKAYRVRNEYKQTRSAVITLQRRFRAKTLGCQVWREFMITKGAAITIQAWFRGQVVRKALQKQHQSAKLIQTCYRRHLQMKKFQTLKYAAKTIQTWYRGCVAARTCRWEYLKARDSVITIQKHYRQFIQRKRYIRLKCAALCLQSHYKAYTARNEYKHTRSAIIKLQRRFRAKTLGCQVWRDFMITKGAAITIQAHFRGKLVRNRIQKQHHSATLIQACYRRHRQIKNYHSVKCAAKKIQTWYRGCHETCQHRRKFLQTKHSVLTIQRYCRGMLSRRMSREMVRRIVITQAVVRGRHVRKWYSRLQWSAKVIQTKYREYKQRQLIKIEEEKRKLYLKQFTQNAVVNIAAVRIQRYYGKYKMLIQAKKQLQMVLILQRWFRSKLCRLQFLKFRRALCAFQRVSREYLQRRHIAAKKIQTQFKKWLVQREALQRTQAATTLQGDYLSLHYVLDWSLLAYHVLAVCCVTLVYKRETNHYKGHHHVAFIATTLDLPPKYYNFTTDARLGSPLLAIWRGRKVRKGCKNKKIEIVRKSLQEANRSATEEKKLGNRTSSALDYLLKYKQLSHILEALIHLDVATRLSPACCERMVEVNAVSVIYRLIRSCNRSQPHMELIKYSVNILLNLAKYDKTASDVYNVEESIDTLIDLMQIYREKGAIFSRTCMLLGIMGMEKCRRDEICENTKLADKIRSIHSLTVRKHRIDEKRLIRQAKQIAAKSFNSTLPIHLPHKKQYKIRPDWVLRKDNMREIEDPLQAINFVMDSLQICPK
ncbi:hypothetical protein KUTeg_021687 [Tegillarca granosa]|uniref:Calponin-homology (CH) domain-containing protein n=1 Tax=Tegillarca granosa TaxID=220873 RepID=A0ABQ9E422_TEGGR|nr:hypothetical protein KUTeg_021687 [Tegillarca granosa]